MADEKARIVAELTGGSAVASEAAKIDKALAGVGGVARTVGGAVAGMAAETLRAVGVMQTINIANAVEQAKQLDLATARLGQSAGVSGTALKNTFDAVESKTLASSSAMTQFATALGRVTYDGKGAVASVSALADEALATGRDLGDELPLAVAMRGMGVEAERLTGELGRVRDIAETVGTIGGPQALKDTLAALGPVLAGVSTQTDESRAKLEALVAVLGKGLKPQQAQAVAGSALQAVRARAMDIERVTGRRLLDDNGNLVDPGKALADIKRLADKRFGKNEEAKRRALMADFGQDLGLAIMRTNFDDVDKLAASSRDKGKTGREATAFRDSKEGKRIATTLAKDQVQRGVAEKALGIHDTLVDNLGAGGALAVELGAGHLIKPVLGGAGKVVAGAGNALASGGGGAATAGLAGVGLMSGAFVGAAAMQGKVLSEIGEDRDVMGARYRNEHADIVAQGLANRAVREGDISGAYKATGGDAATQQALLTTLEKMLAAQTEGNELLRNQVAAGIAAELHRQPLKAMLPRDPNASGGN